SRWPMLERSLERTPERCVVERRISVEHDRFMQQHLLNGIPVLPATFGCEMLAEGAELACPGFRVHRIENFHVDAPLGLPRSLPVTTKVVTRVVDKAQSGRVVLAEVRSALPVKLKGAAGERCHHAAQLALASSAPASLGTYDFPRRSEVLHATSIYARLTDPVCLGQLFAIARFIQLFGDQVVGIIDPPDLAAIFEGFSAPRFIVCPLVLDAALQIAGSWDGYRNGFVSVPVGIESVVFGRPPAPAEQTRAHARMTRIQNSDVYYDISIVGGNSELLAKLQDVHLKRIGNWADPR
ncbi:MAG TPA: polyketide synthase dehydratase domain-containing protein, partial [Polyangiaceae bacterium]